jgi:hypothetical protein
LKPARTGVNLREKAAIMIVDKGDVLFVSHRRMYQHDEDRFFLGRVITCEGVLVKLVGFTFVRDLRNGRIVRKNERRARVLSLASPGYMVYQLPEDVNIEQVTITSGNGEALLLDGTRELMNLAERAQAGSL